MGNNGMQYVFSVILAGWCMNIDVIELCSSQNYQPVVQFCSETCVENKSLIYIGNENVPKLANNNCSCTITPLTLAGQLSVNWMQADASYAANISFVLHNGTAIVLSTGTTLGIRVTGVVKAIYQSDDSNSGYPFCIAFDAASHGTFSVSCERKKINETNAAKPNCPSTTITTTHGSTRNPSITNTAGTTHGSSSGVNITDSTVTTQGGSFKTTYSHNKEKAVLLGPVIGGTCAVILIIVAVIVTFVVVRRKRRKHNTTPDTVRHIEGGTTGNNTYDALNHQNPNNNVNTEYSNISNRSGEVNESYENTNI